MQVREYLAWFEELLVKFDTIGKFPVDHYSQPTYYYESLGAQAWATEAESALAAVFPKTHPCRENWDRLAPKMLPGMEHGGTLEQMLGVFKAATEQIRKNRIDSLINSVRIADEEGLLEQATALLESNHLAAAAVIAGGALEMHLCHLLAKNTLTITGEGSISKYDGAIAKARNDGTVIIYPATDSKLVIAWGGIRNDAAHSPGTFDRTDEAVRRMIEGIRELISRTS